MRFGAEVGDSSRVVDGGGVGVGLGGNLGAEGNGLGVEPEAVRDRDGGA